MAANLVKFVYAATATAEQIAAFDSNTIYFIGNPRQIYKGSTLYDGGAANVAADLSTLESYIGTLPVAGDYENLIDYVEKSIAAGDETVTNLVETLDNSLAAVAKSGAAADVSVADAAGKLEADNVEAALTELVNKIDAVNSTGEITVEKTLGGTDDSFVSKYVFKQGGTAIANGEIEIAKDLVATNGELVSADGDGNTGTFIKMTIANGEPFYINVADLIEYNAVESTDEITLTDTNHKITATVGEIAASKVRYSDDKTVAEAINALETATTTGVDNKIKTAIEALDADVDATAGSVITGITEVDGVITGVDEIALTAANVAYDTTNVKAALDTIGTIPSTSDATTVVGYIDEKVGAGVSALDADLDAELTATDTDAEALAVVTGVTEVDGVITAVDSTAADKAGAATRAKAEVIGQSGDEANANTVFGAKAYADSVLGDALGELNADLDATGTAAKAGVFVVSGVTQTDGKIVSVDSTEVEVAGAAAAAEQAAKDYVDTALTWGSLA